MVLKKRMKNAFFILVSPFIIQYIFMFSILYFVSYLYFHIDSTRKRLPYKKIDNNLIVTFFFSLSTKLGTEYLNLLPTFACNEIITIPLIKNLKIHKFLHIF